MVLPFIRCLFRKELLYVLLFSLYLYLFVGFEAKAGDDACLSSVAHSAPVSGTFVPCSYVVSGQTIKNNSSIAFSSQAFCVAWKIMDIP